MKKNLFRLMALMMVAMLTIGFISCSKDDDDDDNSTSIVGTWKYQFGKNNYALLTFSQNGICNYYEYDDGETDNESASYTYSNSILKITFYQENRYYTETIKVASLTKTTLVLEDFPDGGLCTFTKQ